MKKIAIILISFLFVACYKTVYVKPKLTEKPNELLKLAEKDYLELKQKIETNENNVQMQEDKVIIKKSDWFLLVDFIRAQNKLLQMYKAVIDFNIERVE